MVDVEISQGGPLQKGVSQNLSTSRFPYIKFPPLRQLVPINTWRRRTEQEKIEFAQRMKEEVERLSEYNERLKRRKAFAKNTVSGIETKPDRRRQDKLHEQTAPQEPKSFHKPPEFRSQRPRPANMTFADKSETRQEGSKDLVLPKIVTRRSFEEISEELVPAVTGVVETPSHRHRGTRIGTYTRLVKFRKQWSALRDHVKEGEAATPTSRRNEEKRRYRVFMRMLQSARSMSSRQLRQKWKILIAMVRLIVGYRLEFTRRSREKDSSLTNFVDIGDEALRSAKDEMVAIKHKAITEMSPSSKAVSILRKPHDARTKDDIETVLSNLRCLKGFRNYPEDVQVKLAKYGMYMEVGAKRVIVRQGHDPQFWFFVICGQAIATEISEGHKCTNNVISQGDSFVEGAFENNCPRTCSVTSRKDMHLLAISREHYGEIFKVKSLQDKYPDHLKFIRNMDFMKFWPCDVLLKYPSQCNQQYFKHGIVLCKDSTKSTYIFIVRTGICAVYMYVDAVEASWKDLELWLANPMVNIDGWPVGRIHTRFSEKRPHRYQLYQRFSARNLQATNLAAISCLHLSSGLPSNFEESESIEDYQNCPHRVAKMYKWPLSFLPRSAGRRKSKWRSRVTKDDDASMESMANIHFSQQSRLLTSLLQQNASSQPILKDTSNNYFKQKPETWNNNSSSRETRSSWRRRKKFRVPPECIPRKARNVSGFQQRNKYTGTGSPVYIKMETLYPGDVFGLDQLEEPGWEKRRRASGAVALVSMGAEVILLNKAFYTSLSTVSSFGEVQRTRHIYPSHDAMQARYKLHVAWGLYTDKVCDEFYEDLRKKGHRNLGTFFQEPYFLSPMESLRDED